MSMGSRQFLHPLYWEHEPYLDLCPLWQRLPSLKKGSSSAYVAGQEVSYVCLLTSADDDNLSGELQTESMQFPSIAHRLLKAMPCWYKRTGRLSGIIRVEHLAAIG